jgi:Tfp pilus assembly protein PilO
MMSRDRIVILVVIGVALLGGFWFAVLGPKRAEAGRLSAQLATEQQRLDKAQSSAAGVQRAKDQYAADYAAVANLGKAVPVDPNVPSLLYQLDAESKNAKVAFDSISVGGGGTGATPAAAASPATGASALPGGVTSAPFNFTFTGSFFDLQDLLDRINRFVTARNGAVQVSGRLLTIDDISLEMSEFPSINATVRAVAYQAPKAAVAAAGTAAPATPGAGATAASTQTASAGGSAPSAGNSSAGTQVAGTNTTASANTTPASSGTGSTNR